MTRALSMNMEKEKRRETSRPRDPRKHRGSVERFTEYTSLTASCERILIECSNNEFKDGRVRRPRPAPAKLRADRIKYCQYYRSHGHLTKDCVHLKDAIETLVKVGRLGQYK